MSQLLLRRIPFARFCYFYKNIPNCKYVCSKSDANFPLQEILDSFKINDKNVLSDLDQKRKDIFEEDPDRELANFVFDLYSGIFNVSHFFPFPDVLTEEHENDLKEHVNKLKEYLEKNKAKKSKWDQNERLDQEDMDTLLKLKLFHQDVPKEFGGLDFNKTQKVRIYNLLGKYDLSLAVTLLGHQSLSLQLLDLYGNKEQKERFYKSIVKNNIITAFALYEAEAKTDLVSLTTTATLSDDGQYYLLNGSKIDVINAPIADVFIVFALTKNPKNAKSEMSCFIYEKSAGGLEVEEPKKKLGIRACQISNIIFKNAKVPLKNVVDRIGMGHEIALKSLPRSRFSIIASLSGVIEDIVEQTVQFCHKRTQFGRKIYTFGAIEERLARMAIGHYVIESMAFMLAGNMDRTRKGIAFSLEGAMAKVFSSNYACEIINNAMEIHGTRSYYCDLHLEQLLRDICFFMNYGQSNDILRMYISLNGMKHASRNMKQMQEVFKNPHIHLNLISSDLAAKTLQRYGTLSDLNPLLLHYVHPDLHSAARMTSDTLIKFGNTVEYLLEELGPVFIGDQHNMIRLADAAIYCYAMLCSLSRCSRTLYKRMPSGPHEISLTQIFCKKICEITNLLLTNLESIGYDGTADGHTKIAKALLEAKGHAHSRVLEY